MNLRSSSAVLGNFPTASGRSVFLGEEGILIDYFGVERRSFEVWYALVRVISVVVGVHQVFVRFWTFCTHFGTALFDFTLGLGDELVVVLGGFGTDHDALLRAIHVRSFIKGPLVHRIIHDQDLIFQEVAETVDIISWFYFFKRTSSCSTCQIFGIRRSSGSIIFPKWWRLKISVKDAGLEPFIDFQTFEIESVVWQEGDVSDAEVYGDTFFLSLAKLIYIFLNLAEETVDGFGGGAIHVCNHLEVDCDLIAYFGVFTISSSSSSFRFFICEIVHSFVLKNVIISIFRKCSKINGIDYFVQITLIFDIFDVSDPNSMIKLLRFRITLINNRILPETTWWLYRLMFYFSSWWFEVSLSWAWSTTSSISYWNRWPSRDICHCTLFIKGAIILLHFFWIHDVLDKVLFVYCTFGSNLIHF